MVQDNKKQPPGDVLIVDDDSNLCDILKSYCKNMGCFRNILIANDGTNASVKMRNQKFSVIFLDINLPKKTGMDLLREVDDKSINSKNDIIIVSGALDKTIVEKGIASGIKHFLPKPFTEADFQAKVLKLLTANK